MGNDGKFKNGCRIAIIQLTGAEPSDQIIFGIIATVAPRRIISNGINFYCIAHLCRINLTPAQEAS